MDAKVRALVEETRRIWNRNAEFWDGAMGAGNAFQTVLIQPAAERMMDLRPGQRVLDLGCGNGTFSRRLAEVGANVVAADFSTGMLEAAAQRLADVEERVVFVQADATDEASLAHLATLGPFASAVCNMVLMDMPVLEPLAKCLDLLLQYGAPFVFSVTHPCFNMVEGCRLGVEEEDRAGHISAERYVRISRYITPSTTIGTGIIGQPEPHHYFHRPISQVLAPFFKHGWVVDELEEPTFGEAKSNTRPLSWQNYAEIPPVLVARLRKASGQCRVDHPTEMPDNA